MRIIGPKICTETCVQENCFLEFVDGKISAIQQIDKNINNLSNDAKSNHTTFNNNNDTWILPENWLIFPGMIDVHVHGGYGFDIMQIDKDYEDAHTKLETFSKKLLQEGVTSYLATAMTSEKHKISRVLNNIATFCNQQTKGHTAEILGINLEGPFIAKDKACAQPLQDILSPNLQLLQEWIKISQEYLRIITMAPEVCGNEELINYAIQNNIVVSIGHSNADYATTIQAIKNGCSQATHLFNALPPIHHRNPGPITAMLLDERVYVELIADGIHLHPAILELALRLKTSDKIILITDAMEAKGMIAEGKKFKLAGQEVTVINSNVYLPNNVLAGSVLTMDLALRNILKFTSCSIVDAGKMLSLNPAKQIGCDKTKGSIAVGKNADFVIFDEQYSIKATVCNGKIWRWF